MDRDVYLILIGAGISLASSIVTMVLQFFLSQWSERIREKREREDRKSKEIRAALMDKSGPVELPGVVLKNLIRRKTDVISNSIMPITPFQFWLAVSIGVLVFFIWVVIVFTK